MSQLKVNKNFIHDCNSPKVNFKDYQKSILDMNFTSQELSDILHFYLFNAPTLKNDKTDNLYGFKSLKEYGWTRKSLSKLESSLLAASSIDKFCIIKADSIENTLKSMNLDESICIEHPRAVLKQNFSTSVHEDGSVKITQKEARMECLFRHIRNSFAHNCTYLFENDNILLEDKDDKGKISARMLIPKRALLEWIPIIKKENIQ